MIKLNKNIYKFSTGYYLLRFYVRFMMRRFYRRIEVKNMDNLPQDAPVIMSINHQNALMDAMAFVYCLKKQPVFVARADIFRKQRIVNILMFLKILPIFRIRDGAANLKNNDETFEIVSNALRENTIMGIMPEGSHGDKRVLRPLKKGIFRMAFAVQEEKKEEPYLKIVPVGLEFGHYIKARSTLLINFGEPIEVSDYYKEYTENQAVTYNKLSGVLSQKMSERMIDIQHEEWYESYDFARKMYRDRMLQKTGNKTTSLYDHFLAEKAIIAALDQANEKNMQEVTALHEKIMKYAKGLGDFKLRDWILNKSKYAVAGMLLQFLLAMISFPLHVVGLINNFLPFSFPVWFTRKVKDPQFHSSFKYVLSLIFFPLYYAILMIPVLIFFPEWWMKLAYIPVMPLSGYFSLYYTFWIKKLVAKWKYTMAVSRKNNRIIDLKNLRKQIFEEMDKVTDRYLQNKP